MEHTMGYDTKFSGALKLSRALTLPEAAFILEANEDPDTIPTGDRQARSYMQWVPSETLDHIVYDGNEKFYDYVPWLTWLLAHLKSLGVTATGTLHWSGESASDTGTIDVLDSDITVRSRKSPAGDPHKPLTLQDLQAMALAALKKPAA